jgi:hypothetical protein
MTDINGKEPESDHLKPVKRAADVSMIGISIHVDAVLFAFRLAVIDPSVARTT